jgi:hypothetical protein
MAVGVLKLSPTATQSLVEEQETPYSGPGAEKLVVQLVRLPLAICISPLLLFHPTSTQTVADGHEIPPTLWVPTDVSDHELPAFVV